MASRAGRVAGVVLGTFVRVVWLSLMVLTPLFGFWLASSLAAYNNATQWFSLLVGLLLFPIVPVGWDLLFVWRRRHRPKPAILTRIDRVVLRTLIINGLFLGGMMWHARTESFRALAVRGDWILDGHHGPIASTVRGWMLGFADHFDRRLTGPSTYGESDAAPTEAPEDPVRPPVTPTPDGERPPAGAWPLPEQLHPLVTAMPEAEATTIEAVGAYFSSRITDKRELAKALHDFITRRLHYDDDALRLIEARDFANTPSQTAEAVFTRRAGVCEGYARLMVALGKSAGLEVAYITGHIRDSQRRLSISDAALEGVGHAWNAVKLDDRWQLIDVTWDDPTIGGYQTTYLFTPPQLMAYDHFPDDANWQLLPQPLSLGDFVRQPLLSPSIGKFGLSLRAPTRSQISVDGEAVIVLDNRDAAAVTARAKRDGAARDAEGTPCEVTDGPRTRITCKLAAGEYEVQMFAAPRARTQSGGGYMLDYVGSILVNSK